jgi:hypothetical protein
MAKILFAADIAKLLGWPTWRAKRWMKSTGCGRKRGKLWITTPELLRAHFPEAAAELDVASLADSDEL